MPMAPVAAWKGVRRRLINKLKKTLEQIDAMDTRETRRAGRFDVQPQLFSENARIGVAMQRLTDQVDDLLTRIR